MSSSSLLEVQIPVPSYFVCPISLELMHDPVTLSSGQTFDRRSIEKWLDNGHNTCPVTRHPINAEEEDPIPNHVLRRMIQSWCVQNKSLGIERILTPRQPPGLREIPLLVDQIGQRNGDALDALQRLNTMALDRPKARKHMLQAGAVPQLGQFLSRSLPHSPWPGYSGNNRSCSTPRAVTELEETLRLLANLGEDADALALWEPTSADQVLALAGIVAHHGRADSRQNAALVLARTQLSVDMKRKLAAMEGFMGGVVGLIKEAPAFSPKCCKAGLTLLLVVSCAGTKNRMLAIEAGAVDALADLLLGGRADKPTTELSLKALECLCRCADGRASTHPFMGLIVKHMSSSVSEEATKYAVRIVWLLVQWAPAGARLGKVAVEEETFVKAMAVAQSTASSKTRILALKISKALSEFVPSFTTTLNRER